MKIALDFDGVLCNTIQKWIEVFNCKYSKKYDDLQLSYNAITEFDFCKKFGITHDDSLQIFQTCWESWDELHPTEFCLDQKTKSLYKSCNTVDIVTANNESNRKYLEKFLKKFNVKYDSVVFEEDKEKLSYDMFVDDSAINAQKISDSGKTIFLYNQPWNVNVVQKMTKAIQNNRVYSLDHLIHILQH